MSNEFIVKFHPFDEVECCFDIVALFGNNVERVFRLSRKDEISLIFDFAERIVRLVKVK